MKKPFDKILIANRGEIACRVIRTARRLGIATVAVYSDADKNAQHVLQADEAVNIGPAAAAQSYLKADTILAAARATGAQAIHPGYGFLSENAAFAEACAKAKVVFVGPPASAIRAMGSKSAAKALMEKSGVPLLPGYHGDKQDSAFLKKEAARIGYPVLIKAVAGGGGKGMKLVERAAEFDDALTSARREAKAGFGDDAVLLEKYLIRPRHVEVQIFADTKGNTVYLFERDCSLQRRHQKVVEEAPAPGLTDAQRKKVGTAAVKAAEAVGYVGAGTVEFLMDTASGEFYFMEMNTRLQVEHPVTEMITGQDLVEWQLRVAAGGKLPLAQNAIPRHGHAVEVRIYAEDAARDFLPTTGKLELFTEPHQSNGVRLDSGVVSGDSITPFYDPMIAKLIAWGETREAAIQRLLAALAQTRIAGLTTNLPYLAAAVGQPEFIQGKVDTGFLIRHKPALMAALAADEALAPTVAALYEIARRPRNITSIWDAPMPWRLNLPPEETLRFLLDGKEHAVTVRHQCHGNLTINGKEAIATLDGHTLTVTLGGKKFQTVVADAGHALHIALPHGHYTLHRHGPQDAEDETEDLSGRLTAPTSGVVVEVKTRPGSKVSRGASLMILEAMKTEYHINAPADGQVEGVFAKKGDYVEKGSQLLVISY